MPLYIVPIVDKDKYVLWRERWPTKGKPSARALTVDRDGSLSQTVEVEASSEFEAAGKAKKDNPGKAVISDAIQRLD